MLVKTVCSLAALAGCALGSPHLWTRSNSTNSTTLLKNIEKIQQYWGQLSPYHDNDENYFGVKDVGLPDGCQIEQAHSLQRHAQRFPTGEFDDGPNDLNFAEKVYNFTLANPNASFTGPLSFLNTYQFQLGSDFLTGIGASTEFTSGVTFWNRYGRILYNATAAQVQYNSTYQNLTARPKPVLRTTSEPRIWDSQISWALGFFGPSYAEVPEPGLGPFVNGSLFDVVVITEGGTENNTLAAYDSCFEDDFAAIGQIGDYDMFFQYVPKYMADATKRMNQYTPLNFTFNHNDTYAMQSICAYEMAYIGMSDFCELFTQEEWEGFESTLDIEYFYDYSFGQPTGRAQGLGYLQELLARLTDQYITSSNSSVNSTIDNNSKDFPLGRPFYADFSHDDIIVSVLTAMSMEYFREPPSLSEYPPDPDRNFILSNMTPFGARLITEVIGCKDADPKPVKNFRTQYYPTQYGYNPDDASNKFIRMRLNNGILPLDTIRGGKCAGRPDGLCAMDDFLASQYEAETLANYQFACFANYTLNDPYAGDDLDGTVYNGSNYITVYPGEITAKYVDNVIY